MQSRFCIGLHSGRDSNPAWLPLKALFLAELSLSADRCSLVAQALGVSLTPAATLSAGKLIRGFALRTQGQLPSFWTVEAGPSLAFESGPVVIRQG